MVIDPGDQDDGKTQHEREDRWPEMPEGKPQLTSGANPFRRRDLDVDDQERERDGKNAIAESLKPCVGVRVCHVASQLRSAVPSDPLSANCVALRAVV